jgi:hypothetical protein
MKMFAAANLIAATTPTPTTTPPPLIDPSQGTCSTGTGGVICRWVYEVTGSQTAADVTMWLIEKPLKIALILALAWIVRVSDIWPRGQVYRDL